MQIVLAAVLSVAASAQVSIPSAHPAAMQRFVDEHPQFVPLLRGMIREYGFACPAVADITNRGDSVYGWRLEVLCGEGPGRAYRSLHYAVYPQHGLVRACKPIEAFADACE